MRWFTAMTLRSASSASTPTGSASNSVDRSAFVRSSSRSRSFRAVMSVMNPSSTFGSSSGVVTSRPRSHIHFVVPSAVTMR